jgi:hypothetical protein
MGAGPLRLLADHRPPRTCLPIFQVENLKGIMKELKAKGARPDGGRARPVTVSSLQPQNEICLDTWENFPFELRCGHLDSSISIAMKAITPAGMITGATAAR